MARSKHRADGEGPKHSMNLFPRVILGNISARCASSNAALFTLLKYSLRKEHDLATITSLLEHLPDDSESYKSKRVLFYGTHLCFHDSFNGTNLRVVEANHEYSATISAEFDFRVGDIIAVTATSEDGWWSGYILNEKVKVERHGVFPANFVQMLDTAKPEYSGLALTVMIWTLKSDRREPGFDAVAIASLFERVMAKSKADSAARAESHKDRITILFYGTFWAIRRSCIEMNSYMLVKAKYDYSATISEELDFKAGDMVAVTATFQNGWWSGNLLDEAGSIVRHGSFPSNLMEVPGTVQASYDYSATIPEEFDFKEGDIIAVTATPEDGWWSGDLLGEAGTVVRHGIFPRNYVYPLLRSSSSEE
ncbi:hypothetical protein PENSPDRAFT_338537 [Peniophora sp. CONT]|nr:hypothetical protein PENSPDRAFT_338537 [Peniophora sp. CONT]